MEFIGDVNTVRGLQKLNQYLENCSYLQGHTPSKIDIQIFSTLSEAPQDIYSHVLRWYNHIKFLGLEQKSCAGDGSLGEKISDTPIENREDLNSKCDGNEAMQIAADCEGCHENSNSAFNSK